MKNDLLILMASLLCCANVACSNDDGERGSPNVAVTSVTINPIGPIALVVDGQQQLEALVGPENATDKTVLWRSTDPNVATVDEVGLVTAVAVGTARIVATAGEEEAECEVRVTASEIVVTSINITPEEVGDLYCNETLQLSVTIAPANATNRSVVWASLNPDIATVDDSGWVTAIAIGNATIRATAGEQSDEITIRIVGGNMPADWKADIIEIEHKNLGLQLTFDDDICVGAEFTTLIGNTTEQNIEAVFPESVVEHFTITNRGTVAVIDLMKVAGCKEYFENQVKARIYNDFRAKSSALLPSWADAFVATAAVAGNWAMPDINTLRETINGERDDAFKTLVVLVKYDELTGEVASTTWAILFVSEQSRSTFLTTVRGANTALYQRFRDYSEGRNPSAPILEIDVTDIFPTSTQASMQSVLSASPNLILLRMALTGQ